MKHLQSLACLVQLQWLVVESWRKANNVGMAYFIMLVSEDLLVKRKERVGFGFRGVRMSVKVGGRNGGTVERKEGREEERGIRRTVNNKVSGRHYRQLSAGPRLGLRRISEIKISSEIPGIHWPSTNPIARRIRYCLAL